MCCTGAENVAELVGLVFLLRESRVRAGFGEEGPLSPLLGDKQVCVADGGRKSSPGQGGNRVNLRKHLVK